MVEAGAPARIGAEEGMRVTVSVVGRPEEGEVFSAVEAARAKSKRSGGSGRRLVGSACTYIEVSCRLMKEGERTCLDAGPDRAHHRERLAAHVVMQALHASPHCCQLVLRKGLMRAEAQQHCITGSVKRVADLRQCATEQNALRLLDVTCFSRLDDSHELCPFYLNA